MPGSRKLGRTTDHRKAMLRAMVTFLLENGQIETTVTRAKEVRAVAEKMITIAKTNDLHSTASVIARSFRSCSMKSHRTMQIGRAAIPESLRPAHVVGMRLKWL